MKSEELILQLIKKTGLSREEIFEMMKEKVSTLENQYSKIRALFMVAEELAVIMKD
jgi:hypothetical protein